MANEKWLIDPSVIIRDLTAMKSMYDAIALDGIIKALKEAPTVDAVEVVYCKECKYLHCHSAVDRMFFCNNPKGLKGMPNIVEENPFCPYGERRNEE